jgi:hypothetical protein
MTSTRRKFTCASLALAFFLGACSSSNVLKQEQPISLSNRGLVFGSLSYDHSPDRVFDFALRSSLSVDILVKRVGVDAKPTALFSSLTGVGEKVWFDPKVARPSEARSSGLVAAYLEPGEYELVSRKTFLFSSGFNYSLDQPFTPPLRFTVLANEVTYVGTHSLRVVTAANLFGQQAPQRAVFEVYNAFADDKVLLQQVRPELKDATFLNALR